MNDFSDFFKQTGAFQEQLMQLKNRLNQVECTADSGAGMVTVTINGEKVVKSILIDDELLKESKETMQDMIVAAMNNALTSLDQKIQKEMQEGFNLPDDLLPK